MAHHFLVESGQVCTTSAEVLHSVVSVSKIKKKKKKMKMPIMGMAWLPFYFFILKHFRPEQSAGT